MSIIDSILGRNPSQPAPAQNNTPAPEAPTSRQPDPQPVNPLDVYSKMFDTKASSDGPPSFVIDDAVLSDVSGKLDFISGVDTNLMQKAQQGDAQAMIDLMKAVSQRAYSAALKHTTALTDAHLNRRGDYEKTKMAQNVKTTLTNEALSSVPNSDHPVVRAELRRIAENLARQNPDAPAADIAREAQKYFATVYNAMSPQSNAEQKQKAGEIDDWEKFLT